jgi:anti-sigma-K factor RskA
MGDELDNDDALAAGLVLRTLDAAERAAAERRAAAEPAFAALVAAWEERLAPLAEAAPERPPPRELWSRIDLATSPVALRAPNPLVPDAGWFPSAWRWAVGAGVTAAAAVLLLFVQLGSGPWSNVAPNQGGAQWVFEVEGGRVLEVRATDATAMQAANAGRAFELWVIAGNAAPRSLGVFDPRGGRVAIPVLPRDAAVTVAISVEPLGGSPTGAPTGPVIFTGTLVPA